MSILQIHNDNFSYTGNGCTHFIENLQCSISWANSNGIFMKFHMPLQCYCHALQNFKMITMKVFWVNKILCKLGLWWVWSGFPVLQCVDIAFNRAQRSPPVPKLAYTRQTAVLTTHMTAANRTAYVCQFKFKIFIVSTASNLKNMGLLWLVHVQGRSQWQKTISSLIGWPCYDIR